MAKKQLNFKSKTLIECMIQRKGGSVVPFGIKPNETIYHFAPIDATDPESPHVADVPDEHHYQRLLSIDTAYRAYFPDDEYIPANLNQAGTANTPTNDDGKKINIDEIININPDEVTNDWLAIFAEEVLGINHRNKEPISEYAKLHYNIEATYKSTSTNEYLRLILKAYIQAEKLKLESNNPNSQSDTSQSENPSENDGAGDSDQ